MPSNIGNQKRVNFMLKLNEKEDDEEVDQSSMELFLAVIQPSVLCDYLKYYLPF
jgi:hypothetical protein